MYITCNQTGQCDYECRHIAPRVYLIAGLCRVEGLSIHMLTSTRLRIHVLVVQDAALAPVPSAHSQGFISQSKFRSAMRGHRFVVRELDHAGAHGPWAERVQAAPRGREGVAHQQRG
jgi:hypothetical protein